MATSQGFALDPALIEEIAGRLADVIVVRVVEVLRQERSLQTSRPAVWLDAQEVARQLGVSREWVYEHANELGAMRIGGGPRPRLRFRADGLDRSAREPDCRPERRKPSRSSRRTDGLIPIRDG